MADYKDAYEGTGFEYGAKPTGAKQAGSHFTQPEPINHNELKRLLNEVVDDLIEVLWIRVGSVDGDTDDETKDGVKQYFFKKIDNAILDGDDS